MSDRISPAPGLYDALLTAALERRLGTPGLGLESVRTPVDAEDAHAALAQHLEHLIAAGLGHLRGRDAARRQRVLAQRLIDTLRAELSAADAAESGDDPAAYQLTDPLTRLLAVHATDAAPDPPDLPLAPRR